MKVQTCCCYCGVILEVEIGEDDEVPAVWCGVCLKALTDNECGDEE